MDLLFSFIAMCLISLLSLQLLDNSIHSAIAQQESAEKQKTAIFVIDALVKNHCEENSALGAAVFSEGKRRVEENKIDLALLEKANPQINEKVFLQSLSVSFKDGERKTIFDYPETNGDCIGIARFVTVTGKKALLQGVVCVE